MHNRPPTIWWKASEERKGICARYTEETERGIVTGMPACSELRCDMRKIAIHTAVSREMCFTGVGKNVRSRSHVARFGWHDSSVVM